MPRSQKYRSRYQLIAQYSDGDHCLCVRSDIDGVFQLFSDIVQFRLHGYMTFRSLRLVNPSTHRVLCEYRDYRYLEQSKPFEKLYPYAKEN